MSRVSSTAPYLEHAVHTGFSLYYMETGWQSFSLARTRRRRGSYIDPICTTRTSRTLLLAAPLPVLQCQLLWLHSPLCCRLRRDNKSLRHHHLESNPFQELLARFKKQAGRRGFLSWPEETESPDGTSACWVSCL